MKYGVNQEAPWHDYQKMLKALFAWDDEIEVGEVEEAPGDDASRYILTVKVHNREKHPLCVECQRKGKLTPATVVDHIIPHRGDQKLFWDRSNWQALCHRHHSMKTRREDQTPEYHY